MARPAVLVIPGRLETRTGGYIYDRRVVEGLRGLGWSVDVCELDASFPHPTPAAMAHARDAFASIPAGAVVLVDSLALGAIPDLIERHSTRLRTVALVHLPLSADVAIAPSERADVLETEGRALRSVHLVIVTGHAAVPLLDDYRIPSRIVVIEPGTDRAPLARGAGGSPLRLLTVATLNAGKGYEELLVSLSAVPSRNWRARLGFTQQDGRIHTDSSFGLLWNDQFTYDRATGGVTYANGQPFMVPTDSAGLAAVNSTNTPTTSATDGCAG